MVQRIFITPFQRFLRIEGLSGMLLFFATALAILWANSPYSESYQSLWEYKLGVDTDTFNHRVPPNARFCRQH